MKGNDIMWIPEYVAETLTSIQNCLLLLQIRHSIEFEYNYYAGCNEIVLKTPHIQSLTFDSLIKKLHHSLDITENDFIYRIYWEEK